MHWGDAGGKGGERAAAQSNLGEKAGGGCVAPIWSSRGAGGDGAVSQGMRHLFLHHVPEEGSPGEGTSLGQRGRTRPWPAFPVSVLIGNLEFDGTGKAVDGEMLFTASFTTAPN